MSFNQQQKKKKSIISETILFEYALIIIGSNEKYFKYTTNSKADELMNLYQNYSENLISSDTETSYIDKNLDRNTDYSFDKPDFSVKVFLSNLVIRWEYWPGSTVYLERSQTRNHYINDGPFDVTNDVDDVFNEGANNIFLLKFSYRFGR